MNPLVAPEMIFLVSNKGSDALQGSESFYFSFSLYLCLLDLFLLVETKVSTLQNKIGWHNYCSGSVKSLNVSILMSVILSF